MNSFFIEKIVVSGENKTTSIIEFSEGLNIIHGVSNTGKTCVVNCIDYVFGGDALPFPESKGYTKIQMHIITKNGSVMFERTLRKNKIHVISTDPAIASADYPVYNANGGDIGSICLRLIGIPDDPLIIKNKHYERQRLTWRTFLHTFLIKEDDIFTAAQILMPKQNTAKTAALSGLLYLIAKPDFSKFTAKDDKKIREARKKALENYINGELSKLSERKKELTRTLSSADGEAVEKCIQSAIDELSYVEERIAQEVAKSQNALAKIMVERDKIDECNLLLSRYADLRSQFEADIKRLSFIVDGETKLENVPSVTVCPLCSGTMPECDHSSYIEASNAELARIVNQLSDLVNAERTVLADRSEYEAVLVMLDTKRIDVEMLIKNELQPKAHQLKKTLNEFRAFVRLQNELEVIDIIAKRHSDELSAILLQPEEAVVEYKPRECYPVGFESAISNAMFELLEICKYEGLVSACFTMSDFDVVVNGDKKANYGKGHKAFLNTTLALVIRKYLCEKGAFAPRLFIADSPLLTLKQGVDDLAPESMKAALFQYFIENQKMGQTIIIENEIPDLDYAAKGVKIHYFTKGKQPGRYGFLADVT